MKKQILTITFLTSLLFVGCFKQENPVSPPKDAESLKDIAVGKYPGLSTDGKKLAFSRNGAIFISDTNGRNAIQLTNGQFNDIMPMWSPDGKGIGFIRKQTAQSKIGILMTVDSVTKVARGILVSDSVNCSLEVEPDPWGSSSKCQYVAAPLWNWSPDGSKIAFYSGADSLIVLSIARSDGSGTILGKYILYKRGYQYDYYGNCSGFCWMPSSGQLLCVSNFYTDTSYLYKITIGNDIMERISEKAHARFPTCSSDGRIIGFQHDRGYQLLDQQTGFTTALSSVWYSPKLSPDGKEIVSYSYYRDTNPDSYIVSQLNCTGVSTGIGSLLALSDWDYGFVFHPSSRWVFFSRSGKIYRVDLPN